MTSITMFPVKLIYDLASRPTPKPHELDDEIDRLLYLKSADEPTFLETPEESKASVLDIEVATQWMRRRFEPALLLLLLGPDNYYTSKKELAEMEQYQNVVDKLFRAIFLEKHAKRRIDGLCFDDLEQVSTSRAIVKLKKTLAYLAGHLEKAEKEPETTLLGTKAYTQADIALYNYLKRIFVGKYSDSGLKSHLKNSETLIEFMKGYTRRNKRIIDVLSRDPFDDNSDNGNLLADMVKPAVIAVSIFMFYLWRNNN